MNYLFRHLLAVLVLVVCAPTLASAQPASAGRAAQNKLDIEAVQGVLAVRSLDGWLLVEQKGRNTIAEELVAPAGATKRQWFYFIPASGQPMVLLHKSEAAAFERVPGQKIEYSGYRDLKAGLRTLLKGSERVAMEFAPKSGIPSLTRVDAETVSMVRKVGVEIESSADLVQLTKSLWGPEGRISHYVAVHHLSKMRAEALAFISERLKADRPVTEYDVQDFLTNSFRVRGMRGDSAVATGVNTANPSYRASKIASATIKKGQLVTISLSGALIDSDRPIFASLSWVAYAGDVVPERFEKVFDVAVKAREAAVSLIEDRIKRRRLVKGFEADQQARNVVNQAGLAARFLHRTGHSLDTSLEGDGANLDDFETHDTRALVVGAGFTVGPGIYMPADFGVRTMVDVHIARTGVEITTPSQRRITPLL